MKPRPRAVSENQRDDAPAPVRRIVSLYEHWQPLLAFVGMLVLIVAVHFAVRWGLPLPFCALRKLTGIPCPGCGCTRSLLAWSHLDVAQAFWMNPLFFLVCLGLVLWLVVWASEKIFRYSWFGDWCARLVQRSWWKIGAGLVALNWLYLCLTLPK